MKSPALFLLSLACTGAPATPAPRGSAPAPATAPELAETQAPPAPAQDPEAPPPVEPAAEVRAGDADPATVNQCDDAVEAWLGTEGPGDATASDLNTAGFRCYRSDRLDAAVALFEAALAADNNHALAHYNLAATLAVQRGRHAPCEVDAWLDRILDHLTRSVELDPKRRARMVVDPDFQALAALPRFRILAGADLKSRAGVLAVLQGATFYEPGVGVIGNPGLIVLQGAAPHTGLEAGALPVRVVARSLSDDGKLIEAVSEGGWALAPDGALLLDPDGKKGPKPVQTLRLNAEGDLRGAGDRFFVGLPSECEA